MSRLVNKALSLAAAVMIMTTAEASISIVRNGSFTYDGIISNLSQKSPYMWFEVEGTGAKFDARIIDSWSTKGSHSMRLTSKGWVDFEPGEMVTVSQQVNLTDASEIIFDLRLGTYPAGSQWDASVRAVVLLIDGQEVWQLEAGNGDLRGVYLDNVYEIDQQFQDDTPRTLSLGLKAQTGGFTFVDYEADWDFIKFDTYCGGLGYLPTDFNRDCYVDIEDLVYLAQTWLQEPAASLSYDWHGDQSFIDMKHYSMYADEFLFDSDWANYGGPLCIEQPLPVQDVTGSGTVDAADLNVLTSYWLESDQDSIVDFDRNRTVDFVDFAVLAQRWGQINWLYQIND